MPDPYLISDADKPGEIKNKVLGYLRAHRKSYIGGNIRFGFTWNIMNLLVIVLSALPSILAALGSSVPKWIIIVLPAVSALLSTLLLQFRIRDLWQLRDEGRIEIEVLICKAHLISTKSSEDALKEGIALRMAAIEIEREQSQRFFSVLGQPSGKVAPPAS